MVLKKVSIFLIIFLLFVPVIHSENSFGIPYYEGTLLEYNFQNYTKINQEPISPKNITTVHNITVPLKNAYKITYKNPENKNDYLIVWKCDESEDYYFLRNLHDLSYHYSDYTKDNKSVVFMEISNDNMVRGILLDTENISYTEDELVHKLLGHTGWELTNSGYHYNPPIDVIDASPHNYHPHQSSRSEQWDMAINDPDWYYDHYDYGDNGDIDNYLYENYELGEG